MRSPAKPTKTQPEAESSDEESEASEDEEEGDSTPLLAWLEEARLTQFEAQLTELGAESADDLKLLTQEDLASIGMKVLQVRRFMAKLGQPAAASRRGVAARGGAGRRGAARGGAGRVWRARRRAERPTVR